MSENLLYSTHPSSEWKNGFPFGNGRIAGMVYGDLDEYLALNHELLCRGLFADREVKTVPPERLAEVRKLMMDGKYHEGTRLANKYLGGDAGGFTGKTLLDSYQPAGELTISPMTEKSSTCSRTIEFDKALLHSEYICGKNHISRRCFAAFGTDGKRGCICIEIHSDEPTDWNISYKRPDDYSDTSIINGYVPPELCGCFLNVSTFDNKMSVSGKFKGNSHFALIAEVRRCDGYISCDDGKLVISATTHAEIFINIGAGSKDVDVLAEASDIPDCSFDELLAIHTSVYGPMYSASDITIIPEREKLPLETRLVRFRAGEEDPTLPLLWFNYAKYLLISSCGKLPPNLQGKWNAEINPPWQCNYTFDVNVEMCYWFAEAAALSNCTKALFDFCEKIVPHAREAAKKIYGCRGILFPCNTDLHGRATPVCFAFDVWIGAAPWLAFQFWERWEYSRDMAFLEEHAYPFLKEIAEFYADYLVDVNGTMQLIPSQSPENRFGGVEVLDEPVSLCISSAMDIELCRITLSRAAEAAAILDRDLEERLTWEDLCRRLQPLKTGSHGQLLEWNEEFEEDEPGHRHFSPLIGLYPGGLINEKDTPELFAASKRLLELRLSHGGGYTGWSRSWAACLFARLGDAGNAWLHLCELIKEFATDSLLDLHPPRIFQIDGNFGGAAAVVEMLLRSESSGITLLPALPEAWRSGGSVRGLKAKSGFTLSFSWRDGRITSLEIAASVSCTCIFRCSGVSTFQVHTLNNPNFFVSSEKGEFSFNAVGGSCYWFVPYKTNV